MDVGSQYVLVVEAAARLDVTPQRVRALLASGELRGQLAGGVWMIDPASIANYSHVRRRAGGRALAPLTAWAALLTSFASDVTAEVASAFGIGGTRLARLRALRSRELDDWRWLARRRATVDRYMTRSAYLRRLRDEEDLVPAGSSAATRLAVPLTPDADVFDAYASRTTADMLTTRYRLRPDSGGNVTLRSISVDDSDQLALILDRPLPDLVVAVDLLEDRDPRAAAAGRELLASRLHLIRSTAR